MRVIACRPRPHVPHSSRPLSRYEAPRPPAVAAGRPHSAPRELAPVDGARLLEPRVHGAPLVVGDDAQLGRVDGDPRARRRVDLAPGAVAPQPAGLAVHQAAAVPLAEQDFPHARGRPSAPGARRRDTVGVEALRDPRKPAAGGRLREDAADDRGFLRDDLVDDVIAHESAAGVGVSDVDVAISVDLAAGDVTARGLVAHRVARALAALLTVHVVHERDDGRLEPIDNRLGSHFGVGEIEDDPHAGVGDPPDRVRHFVERAAEPRLLHHHQDLERRPRPQRVHQPQEAGPFHELGAGDPVVDVHVRVVDGPSAALGVRARPLHLARDGSLLVGDVLLG